MEMFSVNFFDYFFVVVITSKPIFQFYEIIESFSSFSMVFPLIYNANNVKNHIDYSNYNLMNRQKSTAKQREKHQ